MSKLACVVMTILPACASYGSVERVPQFSAAIALVDFGVYQLEKKSAQIFNAAATAGYESVIDAKIIDSTDRIPLRKNTVFGFKYVISDSSAHSDWIPVAVTFDHPQTRDYLGKTSTGFSIQGIAEIHADGRYYNGAFYKLTEPYEMVAGEWTITVRYKEKTLAQKVFVVE